MMVRDWIGLAHSFVCQSLRQWYLENAKTW